MFYKSFYNITKLRNLFINNFAIQIIAFQYNNKIIDTNNIYYLLLLLRIIPFSFITYILLLFDIHIIYKKECVINITNGKLKILPIIMKMIIKTNDDYNIDNIKYYNSNIPIQILYNNLNIPIQFTKNNIYVKYLLKGKMIEKEIEINEDNIINPLHTLFE